MPRGGGRRSGGGGMRSSVPMRAPPRAPAPAPRQAAPAPAPQSQGPGLFGQMAATAGGVAIGSAVGHTIGHALTGGGGGGGGEMQQQQAAPPVDQGMASQAQQSPCQFEVQQFLECTQRNADLSMCDAFNQVLKDCRSRYGV